MVITAIHLVFRLRAGRACEKPLERAFRNFAEKCPAFQSVKDCIRCTWESEIIESSPRESD